MHSAAAVGYCRKAPGGLCLARGLDWHAALAAAFPRNPSEPLGLRGVWLGRVCLVKTTRERRNPSYPGPRAVSNFPLPRDFGRRLHHRRAHLTQSTTTRKRTWCTDGIRKFVRHGSITPERLSPGVRGRRTAQALRGSLRRWSRRRFIAGALPVGGGRGRAAPTRRPSRARTDLRFGPHFLLGRVAR